MLDIRFIMQVVSVTFQGRSEKVVTTKTQLTLQSLQQGHTKVPQDENDTRWLGQREGGRVGRSEGRNGRENKGGQ